MCTQGAGDCVEGQLQIMEPSFMESTMDNSLRLLIAEDDGELVGQKQVVCNYGRLDDIVSCVVRT